MEFFSDCARSRRLVATVAAAALASLLGPAALARADVGTSVSPAPEEIAQELLDTMAPAVDVLSPSDVAVAPDPVEAALADVPVVPTTGPPETAPPAELPGDSPSQPAQGLQSAETGDVTPSPTSAPVAAPVIGAPAPASIQLDADNLNVSIRVASPGESGTVTQVTSASGPTGRGATLAPVRTPDFPAATPIGATRADDTADGTSGAPASSPTPPLSSGPSAGSGAHACSNEPAASSETQCPNDDRQSLTPAQVVNSIAMLLGNRNANSSGDDQYQNIDGQYHPANVNISIRIGSPGDDGPVLQTNILQIVNLTTIQVVQPMQIVQALMPAIETPLPTVFELPRVIGTAGFGNPTAAALTSTEPVAAPAVGGVDAVSRGLRPLPASQLARSGPISRDIQAISRFNLDSQGQERVNGLPPAWRAVRTTGRAEQPRPGETEGSDGRQHADAPLAPPARGAAPLGATAASSPPSSGGGGSGLPVALSVPFALVLLSGMRRLRASGAVPSEHVERRPERPG